MTARPYPLGLTVLLAAEALVALAWARLILHRTRPEDVINRNRAAEWDVSRRRRPVGEEAAPEACRKIAFVVPRLAARLPWRADCLVQALAGQRMLLRRGLATSIVVGTAKQADGTFEAHAWLLHGDIVVLGGDISRFEPLLQSDVATSARG